MRYCNENWHVLENTRSCSRDSVRVLMAYDGSGRRVSKTRYSKACVSDEADGVYAADWERELVTHYTGIGTEVRESYRNNALEKTKVVVNMPNGLGRYGVEDAANPDMGFGAGYIPSTKFEWYLKNHLGSTMLVYGTQSTSNADVADLGEVKKAYDYRSFGEQIDLIADAGDKVTENFTGKERDDETELNYFGARYLDPMLGLWISVDPKRQFASPYLYAGNGVNPVNGVDGDGNVFVIPPLVWGTALFVGSYAVATKTGAAEKIGNWVDKKYEATLDAVDIGRKVANHTSDQGDLSKEDLQRYENAKELLRDGASNGASGVLKGGVKGLVSGVVSTLQKIFKAGITSEETPSSLMNDDMPDDLKVGEQD